EGYRPGEGPDRQSASDYFGMVFHGHTITHVDSLAHFFWDGHMYNGVSSRRVTAREGATSHSVEAARGGIITRGVLVDAPMVRGDGVGVADVELAESRCGVRVGEGDVLLLRTGQLGRREQTGPVDPNQAGSAGPLPDLLPLLHDRGVAVLGSDTGNDVTPSGYPRVTNPGPPVGIVPMGLWILDNACLGDRAAACLSRQRWQFLMAVLPLRLSNTTGSPVNPMAIF